jgi:serine/threonine-protein kinase RsbW
LQEKDSPLTHSLTAPSPVVHAVRSTTDFPPILDRVASEMSALGYPPRDVFGMRLAIEEALANALKHGHRCDPSKTARVRCHITTERVEAEVEDEGPGFDRARVADPRHDENLVLSSGRGILLMSHYLSSVRYNERGNGVTLCKQRSHP